MIIGGFQKNSLIDFPETIACIVFTQGCNFSCPYCHNPDLVAGPQKGAGSYFDQAVIFDFLEKRKGMLEGVVITGGEPTLQKDLISFCSSIKQLGYKVKLDSNGSRPRVLEMLLKENLVDFISMDIKTSLDNYSLVVSENFEADTIQESIGLLMHKAPAYEFRTTCSRPFITPQILEKIGKMVSGASRYVLAKCSRNVKVLDSDFIKSDNHFFSDKEMNELKMIIDPYVVTTMVR
ncbi:MAG: anaerobic ribonucleoside-triphosphate reductase activating protein [Pseudomonadota bacterium]